ncbi:MAG TPA: hypothetical protein VEY70_00035 [Metabacillus sp.]|nr:hypothetical protein [Metabacillus sp.]
MNENNDKKSATNNDKNADNEAFKNLASNLLKNEKSLGSVMQLATNLLKNDSLVNSIMERAGANQRSKNQVSKEAVKQGNTAPAVTQNQENHINDILLELSSLSEKLDNITIDISDLKMELQYLKEQNRMLLKKTKN